MEKLAQLSTEAKKPCWDVAVNQINVQDRLNKHIFCLDSVSACKQGICHLVWDVFLWTVIFITAQLSSRAEAWLLLVAAVWMLCAGSVPMQAARPGTAHALEIPIFRKQKRMTSTREAKKSSEQHWVPGKGHWFSVGTGLILHREELYTQVERKRTRICSWNYSH